MHATDKQMTDAEQTLNRLMQTDTLTEDESDEYLQALQEKYEFHIMNPTNQPGVEYSFWTIEADIDFPVISSNTGGFPTFSSKSSDVGNGVQPTESFFILVGLAAHEAMSFMPHIYFREQRLQDTATTIYDSRDNTKPREHEVWAAQVLVSWMCSDTQEAIPELEPIVRWADKQTEFTIPAIESYTE